MLLGLKPGNTCDLTAFLSSLLPGVPFLSVLLSDVLFLSALL
jgi:hypothetical protein